MQHLFMSIIVELLYVAWEFVREHLADMIFVSFFYCLVVIPAFVFEHIQGFIKS